MRNSEFLGTSMTIQAACHIPATPRREIVWSSIEPSLPNLSKTQTINQSTNLKSSPAVHAAQPPYPPVQPARLHISTYPDRGYV